MSSSDNIYTLRKVAAKDSKACFVCYKPTDSVLVAANIGDHFYVCELHLKDEGFAVGVKGPQYAELEQKVKELESRRDLQRKRCEQQRPSSWRWVPGLSSKDEKSKNALKEYEESKRELESTEKELAESEQNLKEYRFKQYKLNDAIYETRRRAQAQARILSKRQEKIRQPGFFPSVPKHDVRL